MKAKKFFRASRGLIAAARLSIGSDQQLGPGITQVLATPLQVVDKQASGLEWSTGLLDWTGVLDSPKLLQNTSISAGQKLTHFFTQSLKLLLYGHFPGISRSQSPS